MPSLASHGEIPHDGRSFIGIMLMAVRKFPEVSSRAALETQERIRQIGAFREKIPQADRLNPESIRKLIYDFCMHECGGDLDKSAKILRESIKKSKNRTLNMTFTADSLYEILRDRTHIKYGHLDALAKYYNVPVSFLLIYTRLYADQEDNKYDDSIQMLEGYMRIFSYYLLHVADKSDLRSEKSRKKSLEYEDFKYWIKLYNNTSTIRGIKLQRKISQQTVIEEGAD